MRDPDPPADLDFARSDPPPDESPDARLTGRQSYNVVADTVTGVNVRKADNLIGCVSVLIAAPLGAAVGWFAGAPLDPGLGAAFGGIGGAVIGLLGSGLCLMIYRGVNHLRGRHD